MNMLTLRDVHSPSTFDPFFEDAFKPLFNGFNGWHGNKNYVTHKEDDGLHIDIAMPGVKRHDIDISVQDGTLRVTHTGDAKFMHTRGTHAWRLNDTHDIDGITAHLEDGILEVVVPYRQSEVHKIEVK